MLNKIKNVFIPAEVWEPQWERQYTTNDFLKILLNENITQSQYNSLVIALLVDYNKRLENLES